MSGLGENKRPIQLPNRRISRGERITFDNGMTLFVHCGFDVDGTVREIFIASRLSTSDMALMLTDQAMAMSYRMQYGPRLKDLVVRGDMMRTVLDKAIAIERDCAAEVIAEYQRYVVPTVMVSA